MSSVPPNMPPGGPYPPYDPKAQWRVYREQQKAAWRAQRDAWKAQHRAGYGGMYGPRVPSLVGPVILIGIGVIALLILSGTIVASSFWSWYAKWWPLLLILAGLGMLAEWALDLRRQAPVRRSGSFVGIVVLLAVLGLCASGWTHMGPWFNNNWGNHDGDDLFNMFGMPEHNTEQAPLNAQVPANAAIDIENPRGDVSVTAGDGPNVEVQAHQVAFANSDDEAKKIFDAEAAQLQVSGNAVLIKSEASDKGRVNLTVTVPKSAHVTVNAGKGDVTAAGLGAGFNASSSRGEVHLNSITGAVIVHLTEARHDFSAHEVNGDLTLTGDCNDLTLSAIKGRVSTSGQIFGEVHFENIAGPVSVHTSVTDLQIAALPGDMTFDSDSLRVNESKGQVRVVTRSKDIELNQVYGDSYVEGKNGRIAVEPAGAYNVEVKNNKGDVELTLPPNGSGTVEGRTHNGDIVTEYPLSVSGDEDKSISGRIGTGASRIVLNTSNGDIHIKKGPAFPATPAQPAAAEPPTPPAPPNARHLKAPKAPPSQPVTQ
jgi:DUF4097 and DUF4098 domain-containing protein YvlB